MKVTKRIKILLSIFFVISAFALIVVYPKDKELSEFGIPFIKPTPTPFDPFPYSPPSIPEDRSYRTLIVGDSIVESLGANANDLRNALLEYYPENEFVNYNYGYGATNIESLPLRMHEWTKNRTESHPPILESGFDLIVIESFAYNPLSEYKTIEEGLAKHTEVLDEVVKELILKRPETSIAFMTPIAPSRTEFAMGTLDLSLESRAQWVDERIAYIENHKKYAEEKGIPIIDVYEMSLNEDGTANMRYIGNDKIHPSIDGIELMAQAIADFIHENKIYPKTISSPE